ncbi:MAG TPA: hypothetical protein VJL58_11680, partial [Pyrinomonadaceae bacterium]|nr:hypothetical protein [Pyrinomonadaceae bacterium]
MKNISLRRPVLLTVIAALAVGLGAACSPSAEEPKKPVVNGSPAAPASPAASPVANPAGSPAVADPKAAAGAD